MKKILLTLVLLFSVVTSQSQINNNPFDKISKSLFENEMLSNRFLRNFLLIKTNTYKKRALIDMDKSLAKFDDNLSYIILHLPNDKTIEEDFMKLQNLWNIYRINITDYQKNNYLSLIKKTKKLENLLTKLRKNILEEHQAYKANLTIVKAVKPIVENAIRVDQILISDILERSLKIKNISIYNVDFSDLKKNLKKVAKFKYKSTDTNEIIKDLKNELKMMSSLTEKESSNPKMLFSNVNAYSKKSFQLFLQFISNK